MALEESTVYRQLSHRGRFSRIELQDVAWAVIPWAYHTMIAIPFGLSIPRTFLTLVLSCVAIVLLRFWFPDGLEPLLYPIRTPHRLSALARDRQLVPYPLSFSRPPNSAPRMTS